MHEEKSSLKELHRQRVVQEKRTLSTVVIYNIMYIVTSYRVFKGSPPEIPGRGLNEKTERSE